MTATAPSMDLGLQAGVNSAWMGSALGPDAVVAVAMSGGVDSSVAAALCTTAGIDTVGVTMRLWASEEMEQQEGGCCSADAVEDARRVCSRLGIPHYVLNMRDHFQQTVVEDFLSQYGSGRTPNPCIRCNEKVKFAELLRRVEAVGATHIATGHYARVTPDGTGGFQLRRGADMRKDQSYTLYRCDQSLLRRTVLPLGGMEKSQVRRLAGELGFGVATKPDSQELCFVGGSDHRAVLARELAGRFAEGPIEDLHGAVVGRHRGIPFYTVGQRQGLGIAVTSPDAEPLYVVDVIPGRNALVVGPWHALRSSGCNLSSCVYPEAPPAAGDIAGHAQLRAHARVAAAVWHVLPGARARVDFEEPQIGVAPGQSLVLYDGDRVVAGGEVVAVGSEGTV
ncbi:MAG: tRNA 2-thiouridine(34) synthase MnmA [Candidatus Dormibacteria bacterium]